ncbi:tape-measure chaperone [Caulobacter phage Sansa]|uniref:Tape-measure chaperone n=1 Tax=Caulobacter phage Sansa TaxID=1675600 RepID=A0A0K1LMT4_9CAUD|nr:tape-measure chaperone [Caulobacter phage Sansa]AKU43440.1 tape-measure chaperone [Caulobacter phage Sansa]
MLEFDALKVFDTDKINNGAWMQFINPVTEEPIFLDPETQKLPSEVRVRSVKSKAFDEHLDTVQRRAVDRARAGKGKKAREEMLVQLKKEGPESFAALVAGFRNVSKAQPGEITPPKADLVHFAKQLENKEFVDQVLEYAADDRNYGPDGEEPGKASADGED